MCEDAKATATPQTRPIETNTSQERSNVFGARTRFARDCAKRLSSRSTVVIIMMRVAHAQPMKQCAAMLSSSKGVAPLTSNRVIAS